MSTVVKFLFAPLVSKSRKSGRPRSSLLDHPPPPVDVNSEWNFGPYSWKVTVEAFDEDGKVDRTFVGYSQNMNIADRTEAACDRHRGKGNTCGEPQMAMKGGECDEIIFMKRKGSDKLIPVF